MTELKSAPESGPEVQAEEEVSRWSLQAPGIDVFWPVLAAVLTAFVIVVASVAHSSMASVGEGTPRTDWTPLPTQSAEEPFVIVQVASHPTRAKAQAEADKLRESGLDAGVLRSDLYSPLKRGWFVVYVGPFEDSDAGRAKAEKVTGEIEDSLVRTLSRR